MVTPSDRDPAATNTTGDDTLPPSEATDSDELRNDDGDASVTAPDRWQPAAGSQPGGAESLDDKLAAEEPDVSAPAGPTGPGAYYPGDRVDGPEAVDGAADPGRHRGQIGGAPEDGESFFTVEE